LEKKKKKKKKPNAYFSSPPPPNSIFGSYVFIAITPKLLIYFADR
jgi:hypothetical protein